MGTFSNWSYTGRCTVWEPTLDVYDQPTGYTRTVFACSFKAAGRLTRDDRGEEFVPSTHVFLEAAIGAQPKYGSYLETGDVAGVSPPSGAEIIRAVRQHDPSLFDEGLPDWEIMTG